MFLTIFVVCLTLCQLTLRTNIQLYSLFVPMLIFSVFPLLFLLLRPLVLPARPYFLWQRDAKAQIPLFLFLLIIFWQFGLLLSTQDRVLPDDGQLSEDISVYGYTSRDGILNYKGMPVNYLAMEKFETGGGALFGLAGELVLYGMEQRYFKGQYLKVHLSEGMRLSDRLVFLRQGVAYEAVGQLIEHSPPATGSRAALRRELDKQLGMLQPRSKSFVQSLILAYRSEMGAGLQNLFRDAGVIHILVLSGMHLGILYLVLIRFTPTFVPLFLREVLALVVMGLYLHFINPGASALRAAIMVLVWTIVKWSGWKVKQDSILSLVWIILIMVNPRYIFDIGMYLSFAAIWGIIQLMPTLSFLIARLSYLFPIPLHPAIHQPLLNLFLPSLSAQSAVTVLTLILFGSIAPHGLLVLPLVLPLFYLSLMVSAVLIPVVMWVPTLIPLLGRGLELLLDITTRLLFPFARIGRLLNLWPLPAKIIVCCLPLICLGYCRFKSSLLSSGHVQLRFGKRY